MPMVAISCNLHGIMSFIIHRVVLMALPPYPSFITNLSQPIKEEKLFISYPGSPPNPGNRVNVGFLIGQQYDLFTG